MRDVASVQRMIEQILSRFRGAGRRRPLAEVLASGAASAEVVAPDIPVHAYEIRWPFPPLPGAPRG